MRIPIEDEAEVRDPHARQGPDSLQALLRRADDREGPDDLLVKELQVLLRELEHIVLVETHVVPVRVDVVLLHPAPEALDATCQRPWHLATRATSVDPVAEGRADRRADSHPRLDRVRPLSGLENIDVVDEDDPEALRRKVPPCPLRPLVEELLGGPDSVGAPPARDKSIAELPRYSRRLRPKGGYADWDRAVKVYDPPIRVEKPDGPHD